MSVLVSRPGVVLDADFDEGVPAHFGDPLREQRSLARSAGLVDRSNRGLVVVSGADRLSWLHSLTSQHQSEQPDFTSIEGLILSPHGHVEQDLWFTTLDNEMWIDCEPGKADELTRYLESMRFMLRVDVENRSDRFALVSLVGPEAEAILRKLTSDVPPHGLVIAVEGAYIRAMPWAGQYDIFGAPADVGALTQQLIEYGAVPAGLMAYEALRIETMRPRLGKETDHRTIPHEIGLIGSAVHLNKGCYRGQETVARVHNLGRPPRRLAMLHLDGSLHTVPSRGAKVVKGEREVGFVGTAELHFEDGPIALAVIKRNIDAGAELIVRDGDDEYAAIVDRVIDA